MDTNRRQDKDNEILESDGEIEDIAVEGTEESTQKAKKADTIEAELQTLKNLATQLDNNYKRALADYQNLQRRTQEEKAAWIQLAGKDLVLKFLPVLDTLMLAEKHTKDQNFVLTVQQFLKVLEDEGVKRIKTVGEKFNPQTMDAVSTAEGKKDTVIEEMRAGFMYNDSVVRPAQVIVGK